MVIALSASNDQTKSELIDQLIPSIAFLLRRISNSKSGMITGKPRTAINVRLPEVLEDIAETRVRIDDKPAQPKTAAVQNIL